MTTILHVISGLKTGGAETTLVQLARALQQRGLPQHVVSVGDKGIYGDELERSGVGLTALNVHSIFDAPAGVIRLSQLMRRLRPDAIQGWMYHGNLMAALAHRCAGGAAGRRLLWNLRASNMDEARYGRLVRWSARLLAWPDIVVSNSHAGTQFHVANGYRLRRSEVIANGIDIARFKPDVEARSALCAELVIPADAVVVMNAARVDPMKDHATFLAAMSAVPNTMGIMAGLRTETLQSPPNVRALGLRHDIDRLYCMADIVVSTSSFGEGFSNAIAEGMSAGLVPIATDVGDAALIVGNAGYVVAPGDHSAVAAAIAAEAIRPPADRMSRGERARARIVDNFSLAHAVDNYERLYLSLPGVGT